MSTLSPWKLHEVKWKNCKDCDLCEVRKKVCLFRGSLPCDVLFIGDGPGKNENALGKPFVGPAGNLLNQMIERSNLSAFDIGMTNLLACIPMIDGELVSPAKVKKSVEACSSRLREIVEISKPRAIVTLGKDPEKYVTKWIENWKEQTEVDCLLYSAMHPGAILRMDISQKGLAIQRVMIKLEELIEELSA